MAEGYISHEDRGRELDESWAALVDQAKADGILPPDPDEVAKQALADEAVRAVFEGRISGIAIKGDGSYSVLPRENSKVIDAESDLPPPVEG